jgi:hypothetical protein
MALPNDSIAVTAGSGQIVATHLVSAKEYEMVMACSPDGHIQGSKVKYCYLFPTQQQSAANSVAWDIYNNSTAVKVRVISIVQIPDLVTAAGASTGFSCQWLIERTTSVGSGGTVMSVYQPDTGQAALDAAAATGVSARSKPTTGASGSTDLFFWYWNSNLAGAHNLNRGDFLGFEILPAKMSIGINDDGILLYSGQGLRCVQVTGGTTNTLFWICMTAE